MARPRRATSAVGRLSGEPDPEAERIWGEMLETLRLPVPRPSFETWLKDTVGHKVTDSEMMVLAPTQSTAGMAREEDVPEHPPDNLGDAGAPLRVPTPPPRTR